MWLKIINKIMDIFVLIGLMCSGYYLGHLISEELNISIKIIEFANNICLIICVILLCLLLFIKKQIKKDNKNAP